MYLILGLFDSCNLFTHWVYDLDQLPVRLPMYRVNREAGWNIPRIETDRMYRWSPDNLKLPTIKEVDAIFEVSNIDEMSVIGSVDIHVVYRNNDLLNLFPNRNSAYIDSLDLGPDATIDDFLDDENFMSFSTSIAKHIRVSEPLNVWKLLNYDTFVLPTANFLL